MAQQADLSSPPGLSIATPYMSLAVDNSLPSEAQARDITRLMQATLAAKKANKEISLKGKLQKDVIIVGNDIATTAFLIFEAIKAILPKSQAFFGVFLATVSCGIIGGLINIGEGIIGVKESIVAFHCGDNKLAWRQLISAALNILIGSAMFLEALAPVLGITFFSLHPWFLPIFFFLGIFPVFKEVLERSYSIFRKKDFGSQLKLKLEEVETSLNGENLQIESIFKKLQKFPIDIESIAQIQTEDIDKSKLVPISMTENEEEKENPSKILDIRRQKRMFKNLCGKMEELQANMGVNAAIEAFSLFTLLMNIKLSNTANISKEQKQQILKKIKKVKSEIGKWQFVQNLRLFSQLLLIISFVAGWFAVGASFRAKLVATLNDIIMAIAIALSLYIDAAKPFDRDTNIVVAPVSEEKEIAEIIESQKITV